jgi:tetratricopeptide (TPR) repeat protein
MGVLYENIEMMSRAEHFYLTAIKLEPKYLPAYNNLAYFYQKLGNVNKAVEYFKLRYELGDPQEFWAQKAKDELLKLRPEYADWVFSMEAKILDGELVKKSHDEFERQMEQSQEHFIKGTNYFKEEKYDEAMKEYDSALRITPNNPKIKNARDQVILAIAKKSIREYSDQAITRLEVGDTISARQDIQRILTTIPDKPMLISR